jgi:hypothetical protein
MKFGSLNKWEVVFPLRQYGVAKSLHMNEYGYPDVFRGALGQNLETYTSFKQALNRVYRLKTMTKAYRNLPIFISVEPKQPYHYRISLSDLNVMKFDEFTDSDYVEMVLRYGS